MKIATTEEKYFGRDLEAMSFAENYHRWIIQRFGDALGAEVVEPGAGTGNFTHLLLEAGVQRILALEPSANMSGKLIERFRGHARVTTANAFLSERAPELRESFDSAVYVNVLEHVEHHEAELRLAREVVRPGGHVLIYVPALPALYSRFDKAIGHWRRYTKSSLREVMEKAGWRVADIRYSDFCGVLPWLLFFTWGGRMLTGAQTSLYDRLVFPLSGWLETLVRPPIGKNLLAVGKRE